VNQLAAFRDTLALAEDRGMPEHGGELGLAHLRSMYKRAETSNFSPSKLGRWLGWAQCAVVAAAIGLTLDDMKALNLRHAPTVENGLAHAPMSMPNPGPDQPGHIHEDCCK
jgi:hypothetical protein